MFAPFSSHTWQKFWMFDQNFCLTLFPDHQLIAVPSREHKEMMTREGKCTRRMELGVAYTFLGSKLLFVDTFLISCRETSTAVFCFGQAAFRSVPVTHLWYRLERRGRVLLAGVFACHHFGNETKKFHWNWGQRSSPLFLIPHLCLHWGSSILVRHFTQPEITSRHTESALLDQLGSMCAVNSEVSEVL